MSKFHTYQCHKKVRAAKIERIGVIMSGDSIVFVKLEGISDEYVFDIEIINKHNPKAGWYYVIYDDGYESFSPPDAFENGYTKIV